VLAIGVHNVAGCASMFARLAAHVRPVLVNGAPGVLAATADGAPMAVTAFTVVAGGYRLAKIAHEDAWKSGPILVRIVRAAQFHEFVAPSCLSGARRASWPTSRSCAPRSSRPGRWQK